MKSRVLMMMLALVVGLYALVGCSNDNNERQPLVAEVVEMNGGAPLTIAGVNDNGTPSDPSDDFVPIEALSVVFTARPLNSTMSIEQWGPYSTFNITHYDLIWEGGPAGLANYDVTNGNLSVSVPVDDVAEGSVLVGLLPMKAEAWFPGTPFVTNLTVVFHGHASGSERDVEIRAGIQVSFVPTISGN